MKSEKLVPLLLDWFERNARDLPWRHTDDPYAIWVSEIMLQQTQVKAVIPFWDRWMSALPTIAALAIARPQRIHKLWEGLGYYTRVRNMQEAARLIVEKHGGKFPINFDEVLELPGIGRYTAGAICSIAFNQPRPILDGNVIRVLTRLFGIDGNPRDRAVNATLWQLAERFVLEAYRGASRDKQNPGANSPKGVQNRKSQIANRKSRPLCSQLNQSLMELGALVCTPKQPTCELCPIAKLCLARRYGWVEELPRLAKRPAPTKRRFVAFVARRREEFLVRQRPAGVVNAHLWEFPNIEVSNEDGDPKKAAQNVLGATPSKLKPLCTIQHSITRYRIRLDVFQTPPNHRIPVPSGGTRWVKRSELRRLPFASAHKKILAVL